MDEFNDTTTIKEDLEDCCQRTESEKSLIATNSFWIEGIGLILVSIYIIIAKCQFLSDFLPRFSPQPLNQS